MEHYNEDKLICPHCNREQDDEWEIEEREGQLTCQSCDQEFNFTSETTIKWSTSKIACEEKNEEHHYSTDNFWHSQKSDKYYDIRICVKCDDKEYVEISKEEFYKELEQRK